MIDAEEIRTTVSVPEVLELLEIEPPARIPGHIPCTAHDEDTPSLFIQEHRFQAFCCGVGGDAIDLVRFVTGAKFGQACQFLSGLVDELHVTEKVHHPERQLLNLTDTFDAEEETQGWNMGNAMAEARSFVDNKWPHLGFDILRTFNVKPTRHALWIPHFDAAGVIRGIKTRSYYTGKKMAVSGSQYPVLYTRTRPKVHRSDLAYLVEGESDTWTMTWATTGRVIDVYGLPSGAGSWRESYAEELSQYQRVVLFLDNDDAGYKARDKVTDKLIAKHVDVVNGDLPTEFNDVTEAYLAGWRPA